MTMPTAPRPWPCSVMCSGVIVMISTMTTWTVTRARIATGTLGRRRTLRSDAADGPFVGRMVVGRRGIGERVRVGPQGEERQDGRRPDERHGHEIRAREVRHAERRRERGGRGGQVRADDRPHRRAPDDGADRGRPTLRREEVGGDIARQLVGGVAEADQDGARKQQRHRGHDDGSRGDERAHDPDGVAGGQPRPPTAADHELGEREGAEGGPQDDRRAGRPAPGRVAGDRLGHDRRDRHGRDVAGAAQRDARDERPDRAPTKPCELRCRQVQGLGSHRGMIGAVIRASPEARTSPRTHTGQRPSASVPGSGTRPPAGSVRRRRSRGCALVRRPR